MQGTHWPCWEAALAPDHACILHASALNPGTLPPCCAAAAASNLLINPDFSSANTYAVDVNDIKGTMVSGAYCTLVWPAAPATQCSMLPELVRLLLTHRPGVLRHPADPLWLGGR